LHAELRRPQRQEGRSHLLGEPLAFLEVLEYLRGVASDAAYQRQPPVRSPLEHVLARRFPVGESVQSMCAGEVERSGPGVEEEQRAMHPRQKRGVLDPALGRGGESRLHLGLRLRQSAEILQTDSLGQSQPHAERRVS
jgi:hypothetical protein